MPFLKSLGHQLIIISSSIPSNGRQNFSYADLVSNKIPFVVDLFIHLASINSAKLGKNEIEKEVNITRNILFSLAGLKCKKLIFFSTSKVYGDNSLDLNYFDENSPLKPACNYGKAKKLCEDLICSQLSSEDLNALILRLPPVINKSKNSNIAKLINLSKTGFPLLSIGQGDINRRSYISFNNIETVFKNILDNTQIFNKYKIFNLSDDGFISLNQLLRVGRRSKIYSVPTFFDKFFFHIPVLKIILVKLYGNFVLDNSKIKKELSVKLQTTEQSLPIIFK